MSHEIVKKIRIEGENVFITSESNNVYPKYYTEKRSTYCSDILKNEGMEAFNLDILKAYEDGTFQEGIPNKWSRAISRLKRTKDYEKFSWKLSNYEKDCPIQAARKSEEFNRFLLSSLNLKEPNEKYIVSKNLYGTEYFICRVTTKAIKSTPDKLKSKIFKIKQEAENIINMFPEFKLTQIS